jgi:hypothetical protein
MTDRQSDTGTSSSTTVHAHARTVQVHASGLLAQSRHAPVTRDALLDRFDVMVVQLCGDRLPPLPKLAGQIHLLQPVGAVEDDDPFAAEWEQAHALLAGPVEPSVESDSTEAAAGGVDLPAAPHRDRSHSFVRGVVNRNHFGAT